MQKLIVSTPDRTLVDAYLTEIARGYRIDWTPPKDTNEDDNLKVRIISAFLRHFILILKIQDSVPEPATSLSEKAQDSGSESAHAAEASIDAKEVDLKLPQPPSDEKRPPPYDPTAKPAKSAMKPNTTTTPPPTTTQEDDFANLVKRFEALKKR